jgi:uncharacterized protein with FMN-binding domain
MFVQRKSVARKVSTNLVALGSAAIVTIYGLGYARTQFVGGHAASAAAAFSGPQATVAAATQPPPLDTPTAIARAIAAATQSPATAPAASTSVLHDGTFNGSGTSRRGDVSVALTVLSGQVTAVRITRSSTYYPISDIARLPGEVVGRQSAQVDMVSGATESSRAFKGAVTQALAQARTGASGAVVRPAAAGAQA